MVMRIFAILGVTFAGKGALSFLSVRQAPEKAQMGYGDKLAVRVKLLGVSSLPDISIKEVANIICNPRHVCVCVGVHPPNKRDPNSAQGLGIVSLSVHPRPFRT